MGKRRGLEFVVKDVECIEKNARHILEISSDGVDYTNNPEGLLNIIAVIGPGEFSGQCFKRAVLCEIGLGGKIPYKRLFASKIKNVPQRNKKFFLSVEQYQQVATFIFGLLQELVDERAKNLNHLSRFSLLPKHWLARGKKNPQITEVAIIACKGIKFSVDYRDNFLLADLYWAVFRKYARRVQWVAKAIYYTARNFRWDLNRNFRTSVEFSWIQEFLEIKLPSRFLRIAALEALPDGKVNLCFPYVAEALNWNGLPTKEKEICLSCLPGQLSRIGRMEISYTSGLKEELRKRKLKPREYAIFRIFPSESVVKERDRSLLAKMYDTNQIGEDDLPF